MDLVLADNAVDDVRIFVHELLVRQVFLHLEIVFDDGRTSGMASSTNFLATRVASIAAAVEVYRP